MPLVTKARRSLSLCVSGPGFELPTPLMNARFLPRCLLVATRLGQMEITLTGKDAWFLIYADEDLQVTSLELTS